MTIEDWATIGGLTGISQYVRIGAHCYVGGASSVDRDVPHSRSGADQPGISVFSESTSSDLSDMGSAKRKLPPCRNSTGSSSRQRTARRTRRSRNWRKAFGVRRGGAKFIKFVRNSKKERRVRALANAAPPYSLRRRVPKRGGLPQAFENPQVRLLCAIIRRRSWHSMAIVMRFSTTELLTLFSAVAVEPGAAPAQPSERTRRVGVLIGGQGNGPQTQGYVAVFERSCQSAAGLRAAICISNCALARAFGSQPQCRRRIARLRARSDRRLRRARMQLLSKRPDPYQSYLLAVEAQSKVAS